MTTLSVWRFETADGGERALDGLARRAGPGVVVRDALAVAWPPGRRGTTTPGACAPPLTADGADRASGPPARGSALFLLTRDGDVGQVADALAGSAARLLFTAPAPDEARRERLVTDTPR